MIQRLRRCIETSTPGRGRPGCFFRAERPTTASLSRMLHEPRALSSFCYCLFRVRCSDRVQQQKHTFPPCLYCPTNQLVRHRGLPLLAPSHFSPHISFPRLLSLTLASLCGIVLRLSSASSSSCLSPTGFGRLFALVLTVERKESSQWNGSLNCVRIGDKI